MPARRGPAGDRGGRLHLSRGGSGELLRATVLAAAPGERLAVELTEHAPVAGYAVLEMALAGTRSRAATIVAEGIETR